MRESQRALRVRRRGRITRGRCRATALEAATGVHLLHLLLRGRCVVRDPASSWAVTAAAARAMTSMVAAARVATAGCELLPTLKKRARRKRTAAWTELMSPSAAARAFSLRREVATVCALALVGALSLGLLHLGW